MRERDSDLILWSIVYVSTAVDLWSDSELLDLLDESRQLNLKNDITGILLYDDGNMMQLIEGPKQAAHELYARIKTDPRHTGIITLLDRAIDERLFADWSMNFRNVRDLSFDEETRARPYLDESLRSERYVNEPSRSLRLLQTFVSAVKGRGI